MSLIYDTIANYNSYFRPLKPRIRFKSLDGTDTYFTFDGFENTNPINVIYADAERAVQETGIFNTIIEDSSNTIEKDHLRNMKVYMDFGKSQSEWKQFFIGFADIFIIRRPRSYYQEYLITGPSTRIQAAELYLSRRQASDIQNVDDPTVVGDPKYNINKIFKDSLTKSSYRPLNKEPLDELTGWTGDLISNAVNTNYPVINEPLTTYWDFWDRLASVAGAVWDIDYNTPDEEHVMLSYNPALHTGVLIKSGDLKSVTSDAADNTSYIKYNFDIEENATADSGTATRLYSTTLIDRQVVTSQAKQTGFTTLNQRFLAQQINIENDQRRITDLAFVFRKIGEPESPNSRLNGELRMDSGDNKPTGRTLATFKIPLSSIDSIAKTIFVNDVDVKVRFLEGSNKIWAVFKDRSGINGDIENDSANTIAWHHDNLLNTPHTLYSASAVATEAGRDDTSAASWSPSINGPNYTYSVLSNIRRLQARTNWGAANRLRLKEAVIDSSFLSDPKNVAEFLSVNLARRSKPRRGVQEVIVTVPNNFLFAPYQWVSFNDGLSDTSQDLQVQRSRIVCSALPGDPQIGALQMSVTLGGLYNSLIGNCSCG
jgi:hypothetical protein